MEASEEKKVGRRRSTTRVDFKKQIYEISKEKHPDLEITLESIELMNEIINERLHKIVEEVAAMNIATSNKPRLTEKDFVKIVRQFPKTLSEQASVHGYLMFINHQIEKARESQELSDGLQQDLKIID